MNSIARVFANVPKFSHNTPILMANKELRESHTDRASAA